mgnify:CR=1 FL=1
MRLALESNMSEILGPGYPGCVSGDLQQAAGGSLRCMSVWRRAARCLKPVLCATRGLGFFFCTPSPIVADFG